MKMTKVEKRFVNSARHSRRVAEAAVRRLRAVPVQPGQHYLDVGCGNGAAALLVAGAFGLHVTGVDLDADQIDCARQAAGQDSRVAFFEADATSLPFPDGSFHIVATNKTLHHIGEWEAAMAESVRVLKPGGYLVFADLVVPRWLAAAVGHLTRGHRPATMDALRRFTRRAGLRQIREVKRGIALDAVWQRPPALAPKRP